jgi:hypothetical protein
MTRITLGELKKATRDRALRRPPPGESRPIPTPMPSAASAVRRFHREGADAAVRRLNRAFDGSDYWGPNGPAQARGWANSIRTCFQTYIDLASADDRPSLNTSINLDVSLGTDSVGVSVDVVLLDPNGYVGRYLLWDTPPLTQQDAEVLAAPVVLALQQELGADRVAGVEVWHLRSGSQIFVDMQAALGRVTEVERIVAAYTN